jgi:predicted kinase
VRAKVNSFLLDEPEVSTTTKEKAKQTASDYYRQAYRYTQTRSSNLILMSGLSGSGKSTVARYLARQQGAIHLRSDAVRKHLAGISIDESGQDNLYSPEMTQKTYDRLLELGILLSKEGFTVILDAKYDRLVHRQTAIARANSQHIPIKIIQCHAPLAILRDRLKQRQGDISDATADLLVSQQANAEAITSAELAYVNTVDTSQDNWQEQLRSFSFFP